MLRRFLYYPQSKEFSLDDPETTLFHRQILRNNGFLRQVYTIWYDEIIRELPQVEGQILELGAGPGFLKDLIPDLITSDLLYIPSVDLVLDAKLLPFNCQSFRAIVMTNVLHHISQSKEFFYQADRCLVTGGKLIFIEPWLTQWSRFIYTKFHHEPINLTAPSWDFPSEGPLSSANEALPWIIFFRDRLLFEGFFPHLRITRIDLIMPILYLLTGGFSSRVYFPDWSFQFWQNIEKILLKWKNQLAMFAIIVITKNS